MWPQSDATNYILAGLGIWLALLTYFFTKFITRWHKFAKGSKAASIDELLAEILGKHNLHLKRTRELSEEIARLINLQKSNFSKYALIRFNPFEDTGGDQSFVLALLDGANNGLVISSLHSRTGTRIYAKQVLAGKAASHQFSKEEKEVVAKAARHV